MLCRFPPALKFRLGAIIVPPNSNPTPSRIQSLRHLLNQRKVRFRLLLFISFCLLRTARSRDFSSSTHFSYHDISLTIIYPRHSYTIRSLMSCNAKFTLVPVLLISSTTQVITTPYFWPTDIQSPIIVSILPFILTKIQSSRFCRTVRAKTTVFPDQFSC